MRTHNQLFIYFICLVSAMGGLLFGYDWVVIGGGLFMKSILILQAMQACRLLR